MQKPAVTVILPSLNVNKYIEECMDSVTRQTLRELEILCIDAGSTDGTLDILEKYAQLDERVKIIHSDIKSYGTQVNMGISLARGKYVAILETDDFIDVAMYESLYNIAEEKNLDFVKADFKGFRALRNGQRVYDEGRVWENNEIYGRSISVEEFPKLYLRDVNIWRGIYNKEFLKKNEIFLNETSGAAFQDIGFCHMFLFYAQKGMYVKDMFYYYRRDSEGSSSNKPYGLSYAYQEYKRLLKLSLYGGNEKVFQHYLYIRMALVFVGEYEKLLSFNIESYKEFYDMIDWFKRILKGKIEQREITEGDMAINTWKKLLLIVQDEDAFRKECFHAQKLKHEKERMLIDKIGQEQVVIFGCGVYGAKCLVLCDRYEVRVSGFSDNNSELWGNQYYGYDIYHPIELKTKYDGAKIIISSKKYGEDIRKQLVKMGICQERILTLTV